jgi:transcriptional regulator with XRE-family HTH domain
MKDRISQFLIDESITPAEFADKIGVQRSSVSHVLNGRNYPSATFIQKILKAYSNLNPRWLILGDGNIYESEIKNREVNSLFSNRGKTTANVTPTVENIALSTPKTNTDNSKDAIENRNYKEKEQQINQDNIEDYYKTNTFNKVIDRIVVFYKDKTFKDYKPSE